MYRTIVLLHSTLGLIEYQIERIRRAKLILPLDFHNTNNLKVVITCVLFDIHKTSKRLSFFFSLLELMSTGIFSYI